MPEARPTGSPTRRPRRTTRSDCATRSPAGATARNVLCWEFGNEFEGWADSPEEIKLAWHREMSDHLRALDPFGHLITTSFWSNTGPEEFWDLTNIDIVQTHCYTNDDGNVAEPVRRYSLHQWQRFQKPHLFGEFGIRSHSTTADKDPQGWAIHNALWAGLFSFCAGGLMPWWHENYLDKLDLYFHFTALANFTEDLPLGTARWQPLATAPPEFLDKSRKPETRDVVILPVNRWGKDEQSEFSIRADGTMADDLHSSAIAARRRPPGPQEPAHVRGQLPAARQVHGPRGQGVGFRPAAGLG